MTHEIHGNGFCAIAYLLAYLFSVATLGLYAKKHRDDPAKIWCQFAVCLIWMVIAVFYTVLCVEAIRRASAQ